MQDTQRYPRDSDPSHGGDDLLRAAADAEARLEAVLAAVDAAQAALIEVRRSATQALLHAGTRRDPRGAWPAAGPGGAATAYADDEDTAERRRVVPPRTVEVDIGLDEPTRGSRLSTAGSNLLRYAGMLVAALFVLALVGGLVYLLFILSPDDIESLFDPISRTP